MPVLALALYFACSTLMECNDAANPVRGNRTKHPLPPPPTCAQAGEMLHMETRARVMHVMLYGTLLSDLSLHLAKLSVLKVENMCSLD